MNKKIDLSKLESLSCLKVPEELKEEMLKSINEVFGMLHEIDKFKVDNINYNSNSPTLLAEDTVNDNYLFDKTKNNASVNIQDGFFLAPKVISK
jgi:aspartyl-tRNA(Asn)/glutamyl-tRNA(Gln) amidotransferase subunit C